jgi:hypothetical protein
VKDFVESVNRLFEIVKILSLEISEKMLKDSAVLLVNSGRAVLHAPEDDDVISFPLLPSLRKKSVESLSCFERQLWWGDDASCFIYSLFIYLFCVVLYCIIYCVLFYLVHVFFIKFFYVI